MSELQQVNELGQIFIKDYLQNRIGVFSILNCETHNDTLCFTDQTGSDYCIECINERFE